MFANSQKSCHLGQGCDKDWTHESSVLRHKPQKPAFRNNHTHTWFSQMLRTHLLRMQLSIEPKATCSGTTRHSNKIQEPETPTCDAYLRPNSRSTTVCNTGMKPRSGYEGSQPGSIHYCSADSRNRTPQTRVRLHIQKLKHQASIKNKMN